MIRTTTALVGAAAFLTALVLVLPTPASTPQIRTKFQGRTAQQWHSVALARLYQRDRAAAKAGEATRRLRRVVATLKRERGLQRVGAPTVSYAIHLAATTFGVETEMNRVASCESGHSASAVNGQYRGVFQEGPMFERGPFGQAGFSVWDPVANAMTAAWTVSRGGWSQWSCKP